MKKSAVATTILGLIFVACNKPGVGITDLGTAITNLAASSECPVVTNPPADPTDPTIPDGSDPNDPPIHINVMSPVVVDPCNPPGTGAQVAIAECDPSASDIVWNGGAIQVKSGTNSYAVKAIDYVKTISGKLSLKGVTTDSGNMPDLSSIDNISGTLVVCNMHIGTIHTNSAKILLVGSVVDNLIVSSGEISYYQSSIGHTQTVSGKLIELH